MPSNAQVINPKAVMAEVYGTNGMAVAAAGLPARVVSFQRMQPSQPPPQNAIWRLSPVNPPAISAGILQKLRQMQ